MRLNDRIRRLEKSLAPPPVLRCSYCGNIDLEKREGPFIPGGLIPNFDGKGRDWCFCKCCFRRFTCVIMREEPGHLWVADVTFRRNGPNPEADEGEPL